MGRPEFVGAADVLRGACIRAFMEAGWEISGHVSRAGEAGAPALLLESAADHAASPAGHEQLVALALRTAAEDLRRRDPPLVSGALFLDVLPLDAAERLRIQRAVLAAVGSAEREADALTGWLERRHWDAAPQVGAVAEVAERLLDDARLHKRLWDDPRLDMDVQARLAMVCSMPRLVERAHALTSDRTRRAKAAALAQGRRRHG
jgi:hypothetical protein